MSDSQLQIAGIPPQAWDTLHQYGFDADTFTKLRADLQAGQFSAARNQVQDAISTLEPGDVSPWPTGADAQECVRLGEQALADGKVAVAILNGGMATRFGGRVKGVVEVVDGLSFLALKLRGVAHVSQHAPVFLMNSFATEVTTRKHLEAHANFGMQAQQIHFIRQNISMRLTPDGALFHDAAGHVSFYAPGHGDLLGALAGAPAFASFVQQGGQLVVVSNVDNLGATLSPKVIGAHLRSGRAITVEVTRKILGEAGGAPVRRHGRIEVLESFRFPASFDMHQIPVFNTNTFVLRADAVRADYPLTWFRADKEVEGHKVVQFERLLGEVTSFADAGYLEVPRDGDEGRFLPVKTPQDLPGVVPVVRRIFKL